MKRLTTNCSFLPIDYVSAAQSVEHCVALYVALDLATGKIQTPTFYVVLLFGPLDFTNRVRNPSSLLSTYCEICPAQARG